MSRNTGDQTSRQICAFDSKTNAAAGASGNHGDHWPILVTGKPYMPDRKRYLTSDEVADLTGLSVETLAQWRSQKRGIPYLKIGRAVRYDLSDVQAYLEGCRVSVSDPQERRQN